MSIPLVITHLEQIRFSYKLKLIYKNIPIFIQQLIINILKGRICSEELRTQIQLLSVEHVAKYREYLENAYRVSYYHPQNAQILISELKINFPLPMKTKFSGDYFRNRYNLCLILATSWLLAQIKLPSPAAAAASTEIAKQSLKKEFYSIFTNANLLPLSELSPDELDLRVLSYLQKNRIILPSVRDYKSLWRELYKYPSAGIFFTNGASLPYCIIQILIEFRDKGMTLLAISMQSMLLFHTLSIIIKRREHYISIVFYDPNNSSGDIKTTIPINFSSSLEIFPAIQQLFTPNLEDYNAEDCFLDPSLLRDRYDARQQWKQADLTLICFNPTPGFLFDLSPIAKKTNQNLFCPPEHYLFTVCSTGHLCAVNELIAGGVIVNAQFSDQKTTPLLLATQWGWVQIVARLLQVPGIQVNLANIRGQTPLDYAHHLGHTEIEELLKNSR